MASSIIPNSAGPGSSIELSEVTIAVRDKVIEKFADEPLDKMNESVKMLLNNEEDEQKRLGPRGSISASHFVGEVHKLVGRPFKPAKHLEAAAKQVHLGERPG